MERARESSASAGVRSQRAGKARLARPQARSPLPLWSRPGYLVRRLHQIHSALFLEECRAYNVTPVQYGLLSALAADPGTDQVSLAAELGIDRANVADVLARLADRGLVRRAGSDADRRVKLAYLTEEGAKLTRRMHDAMRRAQDRLIAPLSRAERTQFMDMLTRLVEANNQYGRALFRPS